MGEYVEKIPSLVAVAYFLPGRAKDLSAPLISKFLFPPSSFVCGCVCVCACALSEGPVLVVVLLLYVFYVHCAALQ